MMLAVVFRRHSQRTDALAAGGGRPTSPGGSTAGGRGGEGQRHAHGHGDGG